MEGTTMNTETTEREDWVTTPIGKPTYSVLAEMVAALECDYDRLEELRATRDDTEVGLHDDEKEELAELEAAAGDCEDREDAERRIQEDPLSIEVRSGWTTLGNPLEAEEYMILLSTGGPATRITGELDQHKQPSSAKLEVQDWFKPWTEYRGATSPTDPTTFEPIDEDVLLTYAQQFYFGD
jgi:hypothetical protein